VRDIQDHVVSFPFGFGLPVTPAQVHGQLATAFLEAVGHLADDFRVVGNCFLAFARERTTRLRYGS